MLHDLKPPETAAMWDTICETCRFYMSFYSKFLQTSWADMTPVKYGVLLVSIGLFGWLLMKSSVKKC